MQRAKYAFLSMLFCLLAGGMLMAQINHPTSGTVNETVTCGTTVNYYDSGGAGSNYSSSESGTITFCPSDPSEQLTISFSLADIETSFSGCFDQLTISDANGTLFDGCGEPSGDGGNAGSGADDLDVGDFFTSTGADGCLTIFFDSDGSVTEQGWAATVTCGTPEPSTDITHPSSGTQNETITCGEETLFYDSGGAAGNYSSNESGTTVICPDSPGESVVIQFTQADIETSFSGCFDQLTISDANGTLFDGCGEPSGDGGNAGSGADDLNIGDSFGSTAADGCLTIFFDSDGSVQEQGWTAVLTCGDPPPPSTDITHPTSGTENATITCGEETLFYDSGGPGGNYSSNESGTTIICPSETGSAVTIQFSQVDIETRSSSPGCWDFLTISDANGTLFNGCGEPSGDGSQAGTDADDLDIGDSFTSTAADGCLTVFFDSDGSLQEGGWTATLTCEEGEEPVPGCTDPNSCNYNPLATVDDGSCEYTSCAGCTNPDAINYDPTATIDDGSCILPAPNDDCFDAITILCGQTMMGNTDLATFNEAPDCGDDEVFNPDAPGVWYKFTGDGDDVTLSLCGSSYDTQIAVYSGNCDGLLECVVANDDSECGLQSEVIFSTEPGTVYYVLVNGYDGETGSFVLSRSCGCEEEGPVPPGYFNVDIGNANGDAYSNFCEETICVESYGFPFPNQDLTHYLFTFVGGDAVFTAKVESVSPFGKGGIMFRESLSPGSKKAALKTQFTSSTLLWRDVRLTENGYHHSQQIPRPGHTWLRLVREGNYFRGYTSIDGSTYYFAFSQYLPMDVCIDIGFFVESPNVNTLSTACFSNVSLEGSGGCEINLANAGDLNGAVSGESKFAPSQDFTVYPNPATDEVNIGLQQYQSQTATIQITNSLGQVITTRQLDDIEHETERFDLHGWSNGVYMISVVVEGQETKTKRFVVGTSRP